MGPFGRCHYKLLCNPTLPCAVSEIQIKLTCFWELHFSLFSSGRGVEVLLSGKENPSGLRSRQEHIVGCNNGQQANQKE